MLLEKYRISCAPGYVVCERGDLYRLATLDALGRRKKTIKVLHFYAGAGKVKSYDIWIKGKVKRFSEKQLKLFYEEVKEKDRKIIMLPSNYHRQGIAERMARADMDSSSDASYGVQLTSLDEN